MTAAAPTPGPDGIIGNYRITRLIGTGAMGAVYEASHQHFRRRAAIKILLPRYAQDPELIARFGNEARAMALIHHPHVVNIFDFGTLPSGGAYLVMEFLEGESLGQRLSRQRGPLAEALPIAHQVALGVLAAHQQGIIHRDLKPGNVMLVPRRDQPGSAQIKVVDFGLAKVSGPDRNANLPETKSGLIMGTPSYLAPEQCLGQADIDAQVDVYSLGIILYEMLAGRRPFISPHMHELVDMHVKHRPPPLRQLRPEVNADAAALVERMLHKKPADRPDMAQVAREIGAMIGEGSLVPSAIVISDLPADAHGMVSVQISRRSLLFGLCGLGVSGAALAAGIIYLRGRSTVPVELGGGEAVRTPASLASPSPQAEPPRPAQVTWRIDSRPSGAQVLSKQGGAQLGHTPLSLSRPQGQGEEEVVLRLRDHLDQTLRLPRDRDAERLVEMTAISNDSVPRLR